MRGVPLPQATRQLPLRVTVLPGQDLRCSGSRVISADPLPLGSLETSLSAHLHRALRLLSLPGPLLRVQAWGLDPRELTLQGIAGAKALFGVLPPTLETSQSRWPIQGQLVSPEPQGPMERAVHAVCTSHAPAPRKWREPWALRVHPGRGLCSVYCACALCPGPGVSRGHCMCALCPGRGVRREHCACAMCPGRGVRRGRCACAVRPGHGTRDVYCPCAMRPGGGEGAQGRQKLSGIFPNC